MPRSADGDFACADDLLWAATAGQLLKAGPIQVFPSGRIGPLIEMAMARRAMTVAYAQVQFKAPFAKAIEAAVTKRFISGCERGARGGVFPLRRHHPNAENQELWDLWAARAESAAHRADIPRSLAAGLIGALGELQENVYVHSRRPSTGLAAFAAKDGFFEFVVSDAGIGVLATLRKNPALRDLPDAGVALRRAMEDGISRLEPCGGRGYGIGQLFRALAGYEGELRFRSDDYALTLRGHSPSLQGRLEVAQKARLPGLTVSMLCPSPRRKKEQVD